MFFKKNRLLDFVEQALDSVTQENVRLRAENSKLQEKLMSFCSDSFARYYGVKLQEKQLDAVTIKNTLMEQLGANKTPMSKEEKKENEDTDLILSNVLGVS